jgi:XapX domain-containing protein
MSARRSVNGAIAGAAAAAVWAAQQPLDKRLFDCRYDDVELLGKVVSADERVWPAAGLALHLQNGIAFGAVYAAVRPRLPLPPVLAGIAAALAEHAALWPLVALTDRLHPARGELQRLGGSRRAWLQAAWRHALFGAVLGLLEERLNASEDITDQVIPVASNGHGSIERAAATAS